MDQQSSDHPGLSAPRGSVLQRLLDDGYFFEFFQAVRILERACPEYEPVGGDGAPDREVVRFGAHPSVNFPASEIYDITPGDAGKRPQMNVTFFGMFGPLGALPQFYTELIQQRLAQKDKVLLEFLNLFNHRLLSLFYRAWGKYRFWTGSERMLHREALATQQGGEALRAFVFDEQAALDPIGQVLFSLVGLGDISSRHSPRVRDRLASRTEISDQTWQFYSGFLSDQRRHFAGLVRIVADFFGCPVQVQPLCGRWLPLEPADRTKLVRRANNELGIDSIIGSKVWEVQSKFRLILGPLSYAAFCQFIPIGSAHVPLGQLVRFYVRAGFDFDIELRLLREEVPEFRLGSKAGIGSRLGWNCWTKTPGFPRPTVEAVIRVQEKISCE